MIPQESLPVNTASSSEGERPNLDSLSVTSPSQNTLYVKSSQGTRKNFNLLS